LGEQGFARDRGVCGELQIVYPPVSIRAESAVVYDTISLDHPILNQDNRLSTLPLTADHTEAGYALTITQLAY
jgi:hypothetical protein